MDELNEAAETIKLLKILFIFISLFLKVYLFLQRGREGEGEGEKQQCVVASYVPPLGTWPTTQACALTGNKTGNPLVCRPALSPLSHISQSETIKLLEENIGGKLYNIGFGNDFLDDIKSTGSKRKK